MKLAPIYDHTVDLECLTGGIVIDAGCRDFLFSKEMQSLGEKVYAFDLENMEAPGGIHFVRAAILGRTEMVRYIDTRDPQAKHIHRGLGGLEVEGISISLLAALLGDNIDCIKMDIEGSEIDSLLSLKKPIAKQISVEFHLHTGTPMIEVRKVFTHLNDIGYKKVFEEYSEKHGVQKNYWDVLFIKSELC